MDTLVTPVTPTLPVLPRLCFDAWHDAVSDAFVPLEAVASPTNPFTGDLAAANLGPLELAYVGGSPVTVRRTARTIKQADRGYLKVGVQVRGYCVLTQDGREAALTPGDLGVYDTTRPYELSFERDFQMLVLMLPRELLSVRTRQLSELTARRISGRTGLGAVLSPFLAALAGRALSGEVQPSMEVCDAVLDLLTATCRSAADDTIDGTPQAARQALLLRIQNYIEERLGDQDLDSANIAGAHHISLRYLQKLFADEGSTVGGWIRQRRLDRCYRDLTDARLREVPVAAIGSRWGYPDAANFTRAFKAAYRATPSSLRE